MVIKTEQSIEKKTAKGIAWRYAEEISTKIVSFIVSIVLARLLIPDDYSLVSIAAIIINCVDILIDSGLSTAIIQKGNADKKDYETALAYGLGVSVILYIIIFFSAPGLSQLYQNEGLSNVLRILCIVIIIKSVRNIFSTKIRVNLQFKKLFFSSLIGTVCSAIVGIILAYNGFGVWALVLQQLTDAIIDTIIMAIVSRLVIAPRFAPSRFKSLFSYSSKMLISSTVGQISNAASPALIGLRYSTLDLTYYTKAKGLASFIISFIETPLSQVLFPALAIIKDEKEKILSFLRKFYKALYFFTLPALCGLYVVADDFVLLLLTEKWLFIVPYLRVFIIAILFNKNIQGIKAIGRNDLYMKVTITTHILGIIYLLIALIFFNDPISVAWAYVPKCVTYFIFIIYLECRYLGYKILDQMKDILPSLIRSIIMAVAVYFIGRIPQISELTALIRFIILVSSGALIYIVLNPFLIKNKICTIFKK